MALQIGNKTYRNIPEQIQKNKEDIATHYEIDRTLSSWGIKVLGVYATSDLLPTENNEYGDAYAVGTATPYTYYVWTRANSNVGQETDYWLNVGALSLVGPQGPQGAQGIQGIQGVRGSNWTSHSNLPTASQPGNVGDQWLETTTGDVYQKGTSTWTRTGNIKGPQGVQGPTGPQGVQGIEGPYGPQGPKGDTGSQYIIAGNLESIDLLPTPTEENRHQAYGVKNANNGYDLYLIIGTNNLIWFNYGPITAAQGAQGPTGAQGPMGQGQEILLIDSWLSSDSNFHTGIVPEEYRDENRLKLARLQLLSYGVYSYCYGNFDIFGYLIFVYINNDDSGQGELFANIMYMYSDWTIERGDNFQLAPQVKSAQIIDDQGRLELVTYNSNGDTVDINESPNQFLQRRLDKPSAEWSSYTDDNTFAEWFRTQDFYKGQIVWLDFNEGDYSSYCIIQSIGSNNSLELIPITALAFASNFIFKIEISGITGNSILIYRITSFDGRSEYNEYTKNDIYIFKKY